MTPNVASQADTVLDLESQDVTDLLWQEIGTGETSVFTGREVVDSTNPGSSGGPGSGSCGWDSESCQH